MENNETVTIIDESDQSDVVTDPASVKALKLLYEAAPGLVYRAPLKTSKNDFIKSVKK